MTIHMIHGQTRVMELLELSVDFGAELFPQVSVEEIAKADAARAVGKFPG